LGIDVWGLITGLLPDLGDMFKQALINAFTNTITNLLTNAIANLADAVADIARRVGGPLSFLGDAVADFAQNLSAQLQNAVMRVTGALNQYMQETAGVLNKQIDISNKIVDFVATQSDALGKYLETEQRHREEVGAAVTDFLLRFVDGHQDRMLAFVRDWTEAIGEQLTEEEKTALGISAKFQTIITDYIMADLKLVDSTAEKELQAASGAILETISQDLTSFREWFTEIVVKPVTQYNAMFQAMKHAFQIEPDEFQEQLELFEQTTTEYYQKKAKEMARKVEELSGGGGEIFTPR